MKKLLGLCAVLLIVGWSQAMAVTQVNTTLDSTHTSFTVEINTDAPDSAVNKIVLVYDTDSNIAGATHIDSVTSSVTDPDTLTATGLQMNGTTLYYWTIVTDSTTTDTSSVSQVTLLDLTQVIAIVDSTHSSLLWETNYASPDSGVKKIVLLCDKNNPPTTHVDSVTASITDPDSLTAAALDEGAQYYARFIISDSAFTDTSAVDSATTKNLTQVIAAIDSQYTSVKIQVNPANPDSGYKQFTLLLSTSNPPTTHVDSVTASLTDPDTLTATGLTEGAVLYYFRVIVADSVAVDTSNVDSVYTLNMTQVLTVIDTSVSYFKVVINPSAADSAFKKIVLLASAANPPTVHTDSVTTGCTDPDTLQYVSGKHNTKYFFRSIVTDSTHTDTSAVDSVTLETISITLSVIDTTYRNMQIKATIANADSGVRKLVLEGSARAAIYAGTDDIWASLNYVRSDSVTTVTNPDTLQAAPAPYDLTQGVEYVFRMIATDSTGTDTSAIDSVTIKSWSVPTDYTYPGPVGNGLFRSIDPEGTHYRISFHYNESGQSFVSDTIDINDFAGCKYSYRVWGEDNDHNFDSLIFAVYSQTANALVVADTITSKDPDTLTTSKRYLFRQYVATDSSGSSQSSIYNWNYNMWFEISLTDSSAAVGDTMDLDTRYLVGDVILWKP